ncbi:hypothetical protein JCGZ_15484 [Jatropha curcas]|uniref:F-box domain-containing protein n=1 Tax=Jatropha curcas TaxID=180498 RepID=A0A067LN84_JATCU|nr:hypothetical protein JCGZ_15484 [Jatropha curcas]
MEITIPEEIVADILLKSKVKSLLRFKCISKSCKSLISSQDFIKSHLHRSQGDLSKFVCGSNFYDVNNSGEAVPVESPLEQQLPFLNGENCTILCSSDGLVLLRISIDKLNHRKTKAKVRADAYSLFLWNPSTRQREVLPNPKTFAPYNTFVSYGLGYDSATNYYKVVQCGYYRILVFSLESYSWGKPKDFGFDITFSQAGTLTHGAFHWIAELENSSKIVVAFNLSDEKIVQLQLPNNDNDNMYDYKNKYEVIVLQGNLCLLESIKNICNGILQERILNIWVMKEYGVTASWNKLITIAQERVYSVSAHFCFKNDAVFIVNKSLWDVSALLRYDLKNKELKTLKTFEIEVPEMVSYVESLVSPNLI